MSLYTETILPPREGPALPRWVVALIIVVAIHLVAGIYIAMMHSADKAPGQPTDTVMIDLAPVLTAPPQPKAAPPAPKPEVAQPKVEPPPQPTPPPPPPPEPPLQSVPEVPAVMTTPPPVTPPIPKILQAQEAPVVLPPPPPPKPVPDKMQEQKRIELQKRIEQKRVEQERKREEKADLRRERAEKLRKDRAARARAAASVRARQAASRAAAPRAGASGRSIAAWRSEVQARVQAAAHFGSDVGNGSATLVFTVEANGRVVSPHLAGSSGSAALDRTFMSIARRIGRLPPPPNGRVAVRVRVFH